MLSLSVILLKKGSVLFQRADHEFCLTCDITQVVFSVSFSGPAQSSTHINMALVKVVEYFRSEMIPSPEVALAAAFCARSELRCRPA